VLTAGVAERGPNEVDDALLHDGVFPGRSNRLGQPLEPVTHGDQHVLDAAVLQLGEHRQPEPGALTTLAAGPDTEDVTLPGDGDGL
jgi:hypothetical protein